MKDTSPLAAIVSVVWDILRRLGLVSDEEVDTPKISDKSSDTGQPIAPPPDFHDDRFTHG